ncbi:alpha/beta hydrolase family protein [Saccharothrix sp. HUAS TT1]|uniref:alpha/beta hydrolase family protein n=1 Tax=unclassified Saccharothrix TaxID=2593673 RepID=UPI00345BDBF9
MLPERNSPLRRALEVLVVVVAAGLSGPVAVASPVSLVAEEITFSSGDLLLRGTVLAPVGDPGARWPAMVMVHGSGRVSREGYRAEAEAFARAGIVTLVYDKRPKRSKSDVDFGLLAEDALAGLRALRGRPGVDPARSGLWGVSEGGWVAPLAASASADVAFLVTVGAAGVPPERQQSWNLANRFGAAGVTGSLVGTATRTTLGLLVGAGLFPEAGFDVAAVLERVRQPVLGLWGALDRVVPGAESVEVFRGALDRGGNRNYALRAVAGADHTMRVSVDGFRKGEEVSPEYVEQVVGWVEGLAAGAPVVEVGPVGEQERRSAPVEVGTPWVQVAAVSLLSVAFGFGVSVAGRRSVVRRPVRWLVGAGSVGVLGLFGYLGHLASTGAKSLGVVVLGRPLPWLALQVVAVGAVAALVVTAVRGWRVRDELTVAQRVRVGVVVGGGVLFVPWAVHWGLLVV